MHAPGWARLQGLCLKRLAISSKSCVRITPQDFMSCTGLSRRMFFYAKRKLETYKYRQIQFRTVTRGAGRRGWEILVTKTPALVYQAAASGQDRRCRVNLTRSAVRSGTGCNTYRGPLRGQRLKPALVRFRVSSSEVRLAHHLKSLIQKLHWDNCKVDYNPGMAFCYAIEMIALDHESSRIVHYYDVALHRRHALATDMGLARGRPREFRFVASSTVSLAREMGCVASSACQA